MLYFTLDSLGLPRGEGLRLQLGDIDAAQGRVHIREAKGNRDRFVPLPLATHHVLRRFWSVHRNPDSRLHQIVQERSTKRLDWLLSYSTGQACRTDEDATLEDQLRRAYDALYRAKREGRDRLIGRDVGDGLDSTDAHGTRFMLFPESDEQP